MTEDFLHFIWKYFLLRKKNLKTCDGLNLDVISVGTHNTNSGPDFFNARIKIEETVWAGNVEVHINSSDWNRHNHQLDKAYDNVILHVVLNNDCDIRRTNGEIIHVLQLDFDRRLYKKYETLLKSKLWIPCEKDIKSIDSLTVISWLNFLMTERLERKSDIIKQNLDFNINAWEDTLYIYIARSFGFNLNAVPFELLAKSLPLKYILKQKNSLLQIEALLFGQAGMLENKEIQDDYYLLLKKGYQFLKQKYGLVPIDMHLWKFLRLRPMNFPTIRLSQFASLIYINTGLFSKILEADSINSIEQFFHVEASPYWQSHYTFGNKSRVVNKKIGRDAINNIIINTIVPLLFLYGKLKGLEKFQAKALHLLEQIKPEKNTIIRKWEELGINFENACDTQALLELKKEYCDLKKCLNCRIGLKVIDQQIG